MENRNEIIKYNMDINYCENTRNINDMMGIFGYYRKMIIEKLEKDPILFKELIINDNFLIDKRCRFNMGMSNDRNDKKYKCIQCNNLCRLIELNRENIDKPFEIECECEYDKYLIIKKIENPNINININEYAKNKKYIMNNEDIIYFGTDEFTNNMLITWTLEKIFEKYGLQHINNLYISFICGNNGYNLYSYPTIGNINNLKEINSEIMKSLILQLMISLKILEKYNFFYGNFKEDSLIFFNDEIDYDYDKINIKSDIKLKINNFENSSITINNVIRLYNYSCIPDIQINTNLNNLIDIVEINGEIWWKMNSNVYYGFNDIKYYYMNNIGIPMYQNAFNFYAFLILFLKNRNIYNIIMNDYILSNMMLLIFIPEELEILKTRLYKSDGTLLEELENLNNKIIIKILKDIHLHSDPISKCLRLFNK